MGNTQPLVPAVLLVLLAKELVLTGAALTTYQHDPKPRSPRSADAATGSGLRCWDCNSSTHGSNCYTLDNDTALNLTTECAPDQTFCAVERVWYVVGAEEDSEVNNISINRTCASQCSARYVVMGDRTKIHTCTSCCTDNLCNTERCGTSRLTLSPPLLAATLTPSLTAALTPALTAALSPALTAFVPSVSAALAPAVRVGARVRGRRHVVVPLLVLSGVLAAAVSSAPLPFISY